MLGYDSGSDVHPSGDDNTNNDNNEDDDNKDDNTIDENNEDDNTDDDNEDDNTEDDNTVDVELDSEKIDDAESGDGLDDDDADDSEKGKLSAEKSADCIVKILCYMVPLLERMYKDRKADLKEIQVKLPLSRHARELLGYDCGSGANPPKDDNTEDVRAVAEEHDIEEVDDGNASNIGGVAV